MSLVSQHFSLAELKVTSQTDEFGHPLWNEPDEVSLQYLRLLCELLLEPIRKLWGVPVRVNSAFRSRDVELAVSGKTDGQHRRGQAADIVPAGHLDLDEAYRRIWASELPYDQLLLEDINGSRWIHVSVASTLYTPRREALVTADGRNWQVYAPDGSVA